MTAILDADAPRAHPEGATGEAGESQPLDELDRLYAEHFDFVWRSLRRLGVRDGELDDAAQDVFIVLLRRRAEFKGESSHRTWLFGIASNVSHEYRRKRQRAANLTPMPDDHPENARARSTAPRAPKRCASSIGFSRRSTTTSAASSSWRSSNSCRPPKSRALSASS